MTLRLPPIGLPIPDPWGADADLRWERLVSAARHMRGQATSAGLSSQVDVLRPLLRAGDTAAVISLIRSSAYARALSWLWTEVDGDCRDSIGFRLVETLRTAHRKPSTLLVEQLAHVFFMRFDELDDLPGEQGGAAILDTLGTLLADGASLGLATTIAGAPVPLTHRNAPLAVAQTIRRKAGDPEAAIVAMGLAPYEGGRYMELVRQHLFLEELRSMPVGATTDVLGEVTRPETYSKPHVRGRMLGHAALEILIDRAEHQYPGDAWRDAVLEVAGDPRLTYLDSHTTWWAPLGSAREDRVASWLARADLKVFLDALEKFSNEGGAEGMERMLPPRKQMLEGLVDLGIVRRSRLFLGDDVRRFAWKERLSASATLTGSQYSRRALLYLDCGDFHLIEGSHNTQLWTYLDTPSSRIVDPSTRSFVYQELTSELATGFELRWIARMGTEQGTGHTSIRHSGIWQSKFLEFLAAHGIAIDPEAILSRADYQNLRRLHGLPWVNPNGRPVPLESKESHGAA
ncbi:EH signature domain-containing protein [Demequina rhizosphaerae]|uniref:EH signature domain-containing protein n=1 Tax=Demequina rhizosphaerae TaxID=1638985 RepID=UPI0007865EBC|nr:EH signature domain-containing protein [Demequina rhizosphaerae]